MLAPKSKMPLQKNLWVKTPTIYAFKSHWGKVIMLATKQKTMTKETPNAGNNLTQQLLLPQVFCLS